MKKSDLADDDTIQNIHTNVTTLARAECGTDPVNMCAGGDRGRRATPQPPDMLDMA